MRSCKVTVPMSEEDCENIRMEESFDWSFEGVDDKGEPIMVNITLRLETDEDLDD